MNKDNLTAHSSTEYDEEIRKTIPYYDNFHYETINIIESLNIKPSNWLDIGCGTGNLIKYAYDKFKETEFYLLNPSEEMLNIAKNKLLSNKRVVSFIKSNTQNYNEHNIKFDVITAIQVHHYLKKEEKESALGKCYEILKNNGILISFENTKGNGDKTTTLFKNYWRNYQMSQGKSKEEAEKHLLRFDKEYFPITILEQIELMKKIGFKHIEVFWKSYMQVGIIAFKE